MNESEISSRYYGISAAAREVPCAEGTLRALDRRGVIHPIRDTAGRRIFSAADIKSARDYLGRSDGRTAA